MPLLKYATLIVEASGISGTKHQGWEALRLGRLVFIMHYSKFQILNDKRTIKDPPFKAEFENKGKPQDNRKNSKTI